MFVRNDNLNRTALFFADKSQGNEQEEEIQLGRANICLSEQEKILYNLIKSKQDMGIWSRDIKRDTELPSNVVDKSLKSLLAKNLIKEVMNVQYKGRKHLMASEFEPSAEVTGVAWYHEGALDTAFIDTVRKSCLLDMPRLKVATVDMISDAIKSSKLFNVKYSNQQIAEILRTLVLDDEVVEVRSTGLGDFIFVLIGSCYKLAKNWGWEGTKRLCHGFNSLCSLPTDQALFIQQHYQSGNM